MVIGLTNAVLSLFKENGGDGFVKLIGAMAERLMAVADVANNDVRQMSNNCQMAHANK